MYKNEGLDLYIYKTPKRKGYIFRRDISAKVVLPPCWTEIYSKRKFFAPPQELSPLSQKAENLPSVSNNLKWPWPSKRSIINNNWSEMIYFYGRLSDFYASLPKRICTKMKEFAPKRDLLLKKRSCSIDRPPLNEKNLIPFRQLGSESTLFVDACMSG